MARRALKRLAFVLALCLLPGRSLAAPPPLLVVHVSSCDASRLDQSAALHALRAELEADGVQSVVETAPADSAAPVLTVALACDAGLTVSVELRSPAGAERRQSFALVDTLPETRPRAFALAVAEVVRLQWQELDPHVGAASSSSEAVVPGAAARGQAHQSAFDDPPEPPTVAANTSPPAAVPPKPATQPGAPVVAAPARPALAAPGADTRPSSAAAARAWSFHAAAHARWFADYQSASFGGHLGVDRGAFRAELAALFSAPSDVLGQASLGIAAASVGYRVFDVPLGPVQFAGYPLAAAGVTWARATPSGQSVVVQPTTAFYGDVRFVVDARVRASSLTPTLSLEVGRATGLAVHAADRTVGATGGFFLGASAGARY